MNALQHQINKIIFSVGIIFILFCAPAFAQKVVDKTVATVSDGVRTELITYSDLVWFLALQPDVSLTPPSSEDLNRALQTIIDQRLFALEAYRLPNVEPKPAEVKTEIQRVLGNFSSTAEFERRLRAVGFSSINDDNFQEMMEQRVAIEKYLDFRFRSFVVITPEDELRYYRDVFTPDFRKKNPGLLLPPIDEIRTRINEILSEEKVARDIERFLDDAERRAEVVILSEV